MALADCQCRTYHDACGSVVQCPDPVESGIVVARHTAVHLLASRRLASYWCRARTRGQLRRLVQGDAVTYMSAGRRPRTTARTAAWTSSWTSTRTCTLRWRQVFDLVVGFFVVWNSGFGFGFGSGADDCVTRIVADVDRALTRRLWRFWSLGKVLAHPVLDVVPDDAHQVMAMIDQLRCTTPASHHNIVYIDNSHQKTCFVYVVFNTRREENLINVLTNKRIYKHASSQKWNC